VRLLGLAVLAILIAPCVIETGLRIAACRTEMSISGNGVKVETVPSWTTYHQLVPLQRKRLPASFRLTGGTGNPQPADPVAFRTNSLGLRGREYVTPRPAGVFRILCLGDSVFLGPHTHETLTVPARLEHWLQQRSRTRIEVINAGLPDSCPLLAFLQMQHGLLALQPDLIIVDVNHRNASSDRRYRRFTELAANGQPLVCSHPRLSAPKRSRSMSENFLVVRHTEQILTDWLCGTQSQSSQYNRLTAIPAAYTGNTLNVSDEQLSLTLSPLLDLWRLAGAVSARLIVSSHPTRLEVLRANKITAELFSRRVGSFTGSRGIPFSDATPAFQTSTGKSPLFLSNGELSTQGHEAYARKLAVAVTNVVSGTAPSGGSRSVSGSHPPAHNPGQSNSVQTTGGTAPAPHRFNHEPGQDSQTGTSGRNIPLAPFSARR